MSTDIDEPRTFVESRAKVLKMNAICAGFALIGGVFVWTGGPESGRGSGLVAKAGMVIGLAMGVVGLASFLPRLIGRRRVLLVLDATGFDENASWMPAGRVQWADVLDLALVTIAGNDNIAARVIDPDRLQRERSPAARLVARLNRRAADVWIAGHTLPVPASDVFEEMSARWNRSRARGV